MANTPLIEVEINIDPPLIESPQSIESIDQPRLREAVLAAANERRFYEGKIGIRVTDDNAIQAINQKHLGHDYPTDVISFCYHNRRPYLEGEMVISIDTARRKSREIGWSQSSELLLYVVHGTLHIAGMDDQQPVAREEMRKAERDILIGLGIDDVVLFGADTEMAASSQTEDPA